MGTISPLHKIYQRITHAYRSDAIINRYFKLYFRFIRPTTLFLSDANEIVFLSDWTGSYQDWKMDFDGLDQTQLTFDVKMRMTCEAWSNMSSASRYSTDGNKIVFIPDDDEGNALWTINSDSKELSKTGLEDIVSLIGIRMTVT